MIRPILLAACAVAALAGCETAAISRAAVDAPTLAPGEPGPLRRAVARLPGVPDLPAMQWDDQEMGAEWTVATLAALDAEGAALMSQVPADVLEYCPSYARQSHENRRAFWAGLISAMARQEGAGSGAVMRVSAAQARSHGCGGAMSDVQANLSCAVRIAARQVITDNAIAATSGGGAAESRSWRGAARDWLSLRNPARRGQIANWTRSQSYCR
ncbi:MAG: lytic transglycosylase [Paracoccus sp. (in: a-proteobacteria)]|nr:lytic transglycosylase [Paracoccus sp. (in: a-proteobacteria)]